MAVKVARESFSKEEIIDILRRNVDLFKDQRDFVDYIVNLAMYLIETNHGAQLQDRDEMEFLQEGGLDPTSNIPVDFGVAPPINMIPGQNPSASVTPLPVPAGLRPPTVAQRASGEFRKRLTPVPGAQGVAPQTTTPVPATNAPIKGGGGIANQSRFGQEVSPLHSRFGESAGGTTPLPGDAKPTVGAPSREIEQQRRPLFTPLPISNPPKAPLGATPRPVPPALAPPPAGDPSQPIASAGGTTPIPSSSENKIDLGMAGRTKVYKVFRSYSSSSAHDGVYCPICGTDAGTAKKCPNCGNLM